MSTDPYRQAAPTPCSPMREDESQVRSDQPLSRAPRALRGETHTERTRLAWRRTYLAVIVAALLTWRLDAHRLPAHAAWALAATIGGALVVAGFLALESTRAGHATRHLALTVSLTALGCGQLIYLCW